MFVKLDGDAQRYVNLRYVESIGLQASVDPRIPGCSFVAIQMHSGTQIFSKPKPYEEAAAELQAIMAPLTLIDTKET